MAGTGTSATAMLVATRDLEGRPAAATVTVAREEIEEALASDDSPELILEIKPGEGEPRELHVAWLPEDLERIISGTGPGGITFAFEPDELYRALEHPDFEGHGIREAMMLTVAVASASTAMAVGTASAGLVEGTGTGGSATPAAAVASPSHDEASTASAIASASVVTPAHDEASTAATLATVTPATVDSGSGLGLPSVDPGTAALVGGLAGAGLLIVGGTFAARRRIGPA